MYRDYFMDDVYDDYATEGLFSGMKKPSGGGMLSKIWEKIKTIFAGLSEKVKKFIDKVKNGFLNSKAFQTVRDSIKGAPDKIRQLNIGTKCIGGIVQAAQTAKTHAEKLIRSATSFLPTKESFFDDYDEYDEAIEGKGRQGDYRRQRQASFNYINKGQNRTLTENGVPYSKAVNTPSESEQKSVEIIEEQAEKVQELSQELSQAHSSSDSATRSLILDAILRRFPKLSSLFKAISDMAADLANKVRNANPNSIVGLITRPWNIIATLTQKAWSTIMTTGGILKMQ